MPSFRSAPVRRRLGVLVAGAGVAAMSVALAAPASADPSAHTWYRLRMCESGNNYRINTGNGHYGAYQFDLATWQGVGGSGYPQNASRGEQDARALILYRLRGWQPWQCATILGLQPDKDAGSGRIGDIHVPTGGGHHRQHGTPPFPGTKSYSYGDWSTVIKRFQDQMHHRGFFPPGTGQYGPKTLRMVKQLQRLNGLNPSGLLGPLTWRAAWEGKYHAPGVGHPVKHKPVKHKPVKHHPVTAPAYPSTRSFQYGDWSPVIKRFQDQMHHRGFFPAGTGQYGPKTLHLVKRLQRLNGINPSGLLGPLTWKAAWEGRYQR